MPNSAPSGTSRSLSIPRSYTLRKNDFGFSDADGNGFKSVLFTTLPTAGTLYFDSNGSLGGGRTAVVAGQTISAADILAGKLYYLAPEGVSGANYDHLSFQVQDNGGVAGGGVDTDQSPDTLTFDLASTSTPSALFGSSINLASLAATDGFKIQGDVAGDRAGIVSSAGDFNGDGFDDFIVGAYRSNGGTGAAYLIFGKAGGFPSLIDLTEFSASDGFKVSGEASGDEAGRSVSAAGDINGDGFADIIVGALKNDAGGTDAGAAYVLFGHDSGFGPINLASLTAGQGFKIIGDANGDNAGYGISSAGDVNGDGLADIIIGAANNDSGGTNAGAAYVIYGKLGGFGTIDLGAGVSFDQGYKILGDANGELAGFGVSTAGDVNGDGFADIIIGAWKNGSGGSRSGAGYVIFGHAGGSGTIDLGTALDSSQGFKIQGDAEYDYAGRSVSTAGDINGDGFADIMIGAQQNSNGSVQTGTAYVIFGHAGSFGALIDLGAAMAPSQGFKIQSAAAQDYAGYSVSSAGDVNGDGYADLLVGVPRNGGGGDLAGAAYVVFGHPGAFGSFGVLALQSMSASQGFKIQGESVGGFAGKNVSSAGDINGDGFDDILVGSRNNSSGGALAGASYVIFGRSNLPANIAPVNAVPGAQAVNEDGARTFSTADSNALSVSDADAGSGNLTVTLSVAHGALTLNGASGLAFTAGDGSADATMTFAGTATAINTALNGLVYAPAANFAGGDTLTIITNDNGNSGGGGARQDVDSVAISVAGFNDAPVNGVPGAQSIDEDVARTFSGANGNAITVSDVDAANLTVTLTVAHGSLTLSGIAGLDFSGGAGDGSADTTMTFTGTAAAINAALDGTVYTPAAGYSGADTLSITTRDNGSSGTGGALQDADSVAIAIAAVDDAPAGTDATLVIPRSYTLHKDDFGFSDGDGNSFASVIVTSLPGNGILYYDSNGSLGGHRVAVTAGQSISAADILAGKLTYLAPAGVGGADYDHFTFQVRANGGGIDTDPTPATLTFDLVASAPTRSFFGSVIELSTLSTNDGFKLLGAAPQDRAGWKVSSAGDVNGDGFADIIIGAPNNDSGGTDAGAAYVIFGKASGFGPINLANTLAAGEGFMIQGDAANDLAGLGASSAGDINGDGFADIIVGAVNHQNGAGNSGVAYVIFGKSSGFGTIDLANPLAGGDGFRILGHGDEATADRVSSAGDVNGDGFADIIVSARFNNDNGTQAGASYVIFGKAGGFGTIDLGNALGPSEGFKIQGGASFDGAGQAIDSAGDVNGDGFADIIVGAYNNDGAGPNSGIAYVLFGHAGGFGTINLGNAIAPSVGFKIIGESAYDYAGTSVSSAGDINGDGYADIIVGANKAGESSYSGAAYVIFGKAGGFGQINLNSLGADGFKIRGRDYDSAGISVSSAGDVNGDGFADLIVGANGHNYGGGPGAAYVIFGKAGGFGTIDYRNPAALRLDEGFRIDGEVARDLAGRSVSSAGDVNGDGFDDILVGAMYNDGGGSNSGAAYIIFGRANLNSAPTQSANTGLTLDEGATAVITGAMLDFEDVEQADSAIRYTLTSAATHGVLTLDGVTLNVGGGFTQVDLDSGRVAYRNDGGEAGSASFGFDVSDGVGGTTAGQSFAFTITPVNDPPVANPDSFTTDEDTPISIAFADVTGNDSDPDSSPFIVAISAPLHGTYTSNGGIITFTPDQDFTGDASFTYEIQDDQGASSTATVTIHVNAFNDAPVNTVGGLVTGAEDTSIAITGFSVSDADAGGSNIRVLIGVGHGIVTLATNVPGGLNAGHLQSNGSASVLITATQSQINATLAATNGLVYKPDLDFNGNDTVTIETNDLGNDGAGGPLFDIDTQAIFVTGINDAPTLINGSAINLAPIVGSPSATGETVTSLVSSHFSDAKDDRTAFGGSSSDSFAGIAVYINNSSASTGQWQYNDGSGWQDIGALTQSAARQFHPDTALRFNPVFGYSGNAPTILAVMLESGVTFAEGEARNLSVAGSFGGTSHVSGSAVVLNDVVTVAPGDTVRAAEDVASTAVTGFSVTDPNAGSGNVQVTLGVGHGILTLATNVPGGITAGQISANGSASVTVTATQGQIDATLAAANGLLYKPNADYNGNDIVTVTTDYLAATPPGGPEIVTHTKPVVIDAVNDAPVRVGSSVVAVPDVIETASETGHTIASLFASRFSDAKDDQAASGGSSAATLGGVAFIINNSNDSQGHWQYHDGSAWQNIGPVTRAAAHLFHAETAIRFNPAPGYLGNAPNFQALMFESGMTFTDGDVRDLNSSDKTGGSTHFASGFIIISERVVAANDAPVNQVGATLTGTEGSEPIAVTGISVSDPDSGNSDIQVVLSVGHGILTIATDVSGGIAAGQVSGSGTASITITAPQSAINATLAASGGLSYTPNLDFNGNDAVTVATNDLGNTGAGGAKADTDTQAIVIDAGNDAPVLVNGSTQVAAPVVGYASASGETIASLFASHFSDAADDQAASGGSSAGTLIGVAFTITSSAAPQGQWQYYDGSAWQNFGSASQSAALLFHADTAIRFNPAPGYSGNTSLLRAIPIESGETFTDGEYRDLSLDGAIGGSSHFAATALDITASVTAANQAPVNHLGATLTGSEDGGAIAVTGISVSDPDAGTSDIQVVLSVGHGILSLATDVSGGITAGQISANGSSSLTITASQNQINATLAAANGLTYTPSPDFNGNDAVTVATSDLGNSGVGGAQADTDMQAIVIASVNDAPVRVNGLTQLAAPVVGYASASGETISSLFAGHFSDAKDEQAGAGGSSAGSFAGIAIVGNDSTPSEGQWQYFDGTAWVNIGLASQSSAQLYHADTAIRFNPAPGFNGAASALRAVLVENGVTFTDGDDRNLTSAGSFGGASHVSSGIVVLSATVTAANQAPVNQIGATVTGAEDGGPIAVTGISIADPDAGGSDIQVTLSVGHGALTIDTNVSGGIIASQISAGANGSNTITITATQGQINATLADANGLTYTPDADFNGSDAVTVATSDLGNTGPGGILIDTDTQAIVISAVNDSAVVDLDVDDSSGATLGDYHTAYSEGGAAATVADTDVSITDPDAGDSITGATVSITDLEAGDQLAVAGSLPGSIIASSAGAGTIILSGIGTRAEYQQALTRIVYSSASDDPTVGGLHNSRSIGIIVNDGTTNSALVTTIVGVAGIDDPAIARADNVSTNEATVKTGNVFADNGAGMDFDPDGPPPTVSAVNGSVAKVGVPVTLASGALLTLNADGTFSYDPNHRFDTTPAPGSGASNAPAHDSFSYTLSGGGSATVSVTIAGLDGNDVLLGTSGSDLMSGGVGDDRYFVDQAGDLAFESAGQGYDRVLASVSYILPVGSEIERLTTSDNLATTPIDLTGNELGQYLFGNAGANSLDGAGGADVMVGLGGDDRYYIDMALDRVIEAAGEGYDRVLSAVSWRLQPDSYVDKITTIDNLATTAINLTGNNLSQYLFGNAGANTLDGGGGGDVMVGLEGDDRYIIRSSADRVIEAAGGGNDRVFAGASFVLQPGSAVETLSTIDNLGTAAIDLTGNELGQFLYGNEGANVLDGKLGNDVLYGLGGADTFQFTTVTGANNVDRIADFVTGVDKIALDDFIFVGLATGALDPNAFFVGSAAHDADDRIIYNQTTGALYFDYDGNGIGTAVQFATLNGAPILAASDFLVI